MKAPQGRGLQLVPQTKGMHIALCIDHRCCTCSRERALALTARCKGCQEHLQANLKPVLPAFKISLQVRIMEFALLWATYLAIMLTNLEAGIGIGIILATMYFAISYAKVRLI